MVNTSDPEIPEMDPSQKLCVFCNIIEGKIEAKRVYDDRDSVAFLDIRPRARGMTIVAPKDHYTDVNDKAAESIKVFQTAQIVAQMLRESLGAKHVNMAVIRSKETPHFHIRLYPVFVDENPIVEAGPMQVKDKDLDEMAKTIKAAKVDIYTEPDPAPQEKEWDKRDAEYVRRSIERA